MYIKLSLEEGEEMDETTHKYVTNMYIALAHGSKEHREWLRETILNWFTGKVLPPMRN